MMNWKKIWNLKAAVTHLADNGCLNQLEIGDYNSSTNRDLDYVGYGSQDPHHASREFLFGLQEDDVFIDVYRFLYPYDLSYTWKIHNTQKRSRIDLALEWFQVCFIPVTPLIKGAVTILNQLETFRVFK